MVDIQKELLEADSDSAVEETARLQTIEWILLLAGSLISLSIALLASRSIGESGAQEYILDAVSVEVPRSHAGVVG